MLTWIKQLLKKILPPPVNTFNREIGRILDAIAGNSRSLEKQLAQREQESRKQIAAYTKEKQWFLDTIISELKVQKQQNETIISELKEQKQRNETIFSGIRSEKQLLEKMQKTLEEILWGQIFQDTIASSEWLVNKSFSLGRWAVGYQYMYVLYRVLNEMRPKRILELGLGQTTKMIGQYTAFNEECSHFVVEHDEKWIDFFEKGFSLSSRTEVVLLDLKNRTYFEDDTVLVYNDFSKKFQNEKFDLISIDAPFGFNAKIYSRIDILDLLPDCLNPSFVILIDDCDRKGEQNTLAQLKKRLQDHAMSFSFGDYPGKKNSCIITSENLSYFCSM